MAEKPTARVTVQYDVAEKLAPQLLDILRGVTAQFPCTFVEPVAQPAEPVDAQTSLEAKERATRTDKKPGLVNRILGKGK